MFWGFLLVFKLENRVHCSNKLGKSWIKAKSIRHVYQRISEDLIFFSSVQSLSRVQLFVTPWTAARQASLSITNSQSLLKLMSIKSVMPSNHLILCCPLLLPPLVFPSIKVFSNESVLCSRWPKYWSFSFNTTQGRKLIM